MPGANPSGKLLDQFAQRSPSDLEFVKPGAPHVAADAEHTGARIFFATHPPKPGSPPIDNVRQIGERPHILDQRRATEERQPSSPLPRLGAIPLQRAQQSGRFARDIATRAGVHIDIQSESRAEDIPSQKTAPARLGHRSFQQNLPAAHLLADIHVDDSNPQSIGGDSDSLYDLVGMALDQLPIPEDARLSLTGIDAQIVHPFRQVRNPSLRQRVPLPTPILQPRLPHLC